MAACWGSAPTAWCSRGRLREVRVSSQPDAVTVFVKTSREPRYNAELIDGPVRLVVDLADTVYSWRKTPLPVGVGPLRQIRGSQWRKGISRAAPYLSQLTPLPPPLKPPKPP